MTTKTNNKKKMKNTKVQTATIKFIYNVEKGECDVDVDLGGLHLTNIAPTLQMLLDKINEDLKKENES